VRVMEPYAKRRKEWETVPDRHPASLPAEVLSRVMGGTMRLLKANLLRPTSL